MLITTRWMFIARPNRRFTLARIDDAQYYLEPDGAPVAARRGARRSRPARTRSTTRSGCAHRRGRDRPTTRDGRAPHAPRACSRVTAPLIWNGSRDLVAWNLHAPRRGPRARRRSPGPTLVAVLMKAQSQLEDLPPAKRIYWARVLHDLLEGSPGRQAARRGRRPGDRHEPAQRALQRARHEVHEPRDAAEQGHLARVHRAGDHGRARQPGLRGPAAGRRGRRHPQPPAARARSAATCRATTACRGRCSSCRRCPARCRPGPACCCCRRCRRFNVLDLADAAARRHGPDDADGRAARRRDPVRHLRAHPRPARAPGRGRDRDRAAAKAKKSADRGAGAAAASSRARAQVAAQ